MVIGHPNVPVTAELKLMPDRLELTDCDRLSTDSKIDAELGWRHWSCFCNRFNKPLCLKSETQAERAAAAAQVQLFMTYETTCFDIKAASIANTFHGMSQ